MTTECLPVTAVIPTRHRPEPLRRTLDSVAQQSAQPSKIVIVDASDAGDSRTHEVCQRSPAGLQSEIAYQRATVAGAACQRNQGMREATQPVTWFLDDDVLLAPECARRLFVALQSDPQLGGVNALITNQQYHRPGRISRALYALLDGRFRSSYAGRCLGPALNLLPENREDLPEVVPVEWLNTTCTMYRREVLPEPPFDAFFEGYSFGEDVALSLKVSRHWKLANVRTAQIFHDSQSGDHKRDEAQLAEMELVNRHYLMTEVLGRRRVADYLRLAILQIYHLLGGLVSPAGRRRLPAALKGKWRGALKIIRQGTAPAF